MIFKVQYRMQTGAGLHFAADVSIALDYIRDLNSAGATGIKICDAKGHLISVEALAALHAVQLATPPTSAT